MGFIHDVERHCKLLGELKRDVQKKVPTQGAGGFLSYETEIWRLMFCTIVKRV
jgi:hypothetical protein